MLFSEQRVAATLRALQRGFLVRAELQVHTELNFKPSFSNSEGKKEGKSACLLVRQRYFWLSKLSQFFVMIFFPQNFTGIITDIIITYREWTVYGHSTSDVSVSTLVALRISLPLSQPQLHFLEIRTLN